MLAPELAGVEIEVMMRTIHRALTRFESQSELCRLNRDPRTTVPVSVLMAALAEAAVEAARASGGLVDVTVIDALEQAGYGRSLTGAPLVALQEALDSAPPRAPAKPDPSSRWREIQVDRVSRAITRPPGVRIDSGGIGKGLAADLAAEKLSGYESFVVDCGGDVRIGGTAALRRPVQVGDPFDESVAFEFSLRQGAVATSGLRSRIWRHRGGCAHHLIDPSSGASAWTGIVQATAVAPSARTAETLAKTAVLSGPWHARDALVDHGGVLVHDDGRVEVVGSPGCAPDEQPLSDDDAAASRAAVPA